MAKCRACPHKKTCRDECYGENPCDFAQAYDRLTRKVEARDDVIQRQRVELGGLRKCSLAEHSRMFGDYVLAPVQDAFTGKVGWWISKASERTEWAAQWVFLVRRPVQMGNQGQALGDRAVL